MTKKKTPPPPPVPSASVVVGAHVTPQERERIRVAAALTGKPLSGWLRDTALASADAILTERGVAVED